MPNIGALLKEEIARLSRKEIRKQAGPLRKASVGYRHQIAALKRQVDQLQRQVAASGRRSSAAPDAKADATADGGTALRFQARGLRTLRSRLGLSAGDLGKLIGVTAQSVYNWEAKKASPRRAQVAAIAALRGLGKREAEQRLAGTAAAKPSKTRKGGKAAKAGKPKASGSAKAGKRKTRAKSRK